MGGRKASNVKPTFYRPILLLIDSLSSEDDDLYKVLESMAHARSESSSMLMALSFGIFAILVLYSQVGLYSFAWVALTASYFAVAVTGAVTFRNWATTLMVTDFIIRKKDLFDVLDEIKNENKIRKFFFYDVLYRNKRSYLDVFLIICFILIIVIACILWYAIAITAYSI